MENPNFLNTELNPTNGNENISKLQNNSEEEKQPENTETNNEAGRRHYRKDNRRMADFKRTKTQKEKKSNRLGTEIDSKKADLDRGYLIVQLGEDPERVKHVQLDFSDKEMIRSVIAEKEFEKYELGLDISEIDLKIRELAAAKKSSYRDKLNKKKADKIENDIVRRVIKELNGASKNGTKTTVSQIQNQAQSGKTKEAHDSLKSFLSQKVKTVAKKLDKDEKLEKNVLERVLDKLSSVHS